MKKLLKCSISAGAVVALAGSVHAIPTLVVEDGNAAFNTIQTSASGVVTITTSDANWSVVVATGTSSPPIRAVAADGERRVVLSGDFSIGE